MLKRSFCTKSIEEKLSELLKPMFKGSKKEFIVINNLTKNWPDIIGKKYAQFCYPKMVNWSKEESGKEGKLTIAVHNSAVGFFIENNAEIIIERVAAFYGFKAISKIIIKQEPKKIASSEVKNKVISPQKEEFLQKLTKEFADQELAETLKTLGREIFYNEAKSK